MSQVPYADAYWVVEDKFLAGNYPGHNNADLTRKRIQALLKGGVCTFLDLTRPGDSSNPYQQLLLEEAREYGIEVEWKNSPIQDFYNPPVEQMKAMLDFVDKEIKAGKIVYVHCMAGIGRTGTVVGCFLVRHGLTGEEAITQIVELRKSLPNWWHPSPETEEQREFILNWEKDQ